MKEANVEEIKSHLAADYAQVKPGRWRQVTAATVEIEREEKPALLAEWIGHRFM